MSSPAAPRRPAAALALAALGCALALPAGCAKEPKGVSRPPLTIAAAADLKPVLTHLLREFQRPDPDLEVEVSYGSSGNLYHQLTEGAPFDIFFSADTDYPRRLVRDGLARKDSFFPYAVGHLALWVPNDSPLDLKKLGLKAVLDKSVRKIAIANPKYAPYGRAAQKALESAGLYDKVKDKIVRGESVAQAAQFAESGAADVGLISLCQASSPELARRGRYWGVSDDLYPPIEQAGVILKAARNREAAEKLRTLVTGPGGRGIFLLHGFTPPGK
jgi:molybdate transport system substrate-binding protein